MLTRLFKSKDLPPVKGKKSGIPLTYDTFYDGRLQAAFERSNLKDSELKFLMSMHRENLECETKDLDTDKGTMILINDLISFNYLVQEKSFGMINDPTGNKKNGVFFKV